MRSVRRGNRAPPAALSKRSGAAQLTELEAVRAYIQKQAAGPKLKAYPFKAYKAEEVKRRLEELFHGKCAYCESFYASQAPVDVEHYRPKGAVEGEPDHFGYWWLAMEWANLLPSCIDCNRRRKQLAPAGISDLKLLYTGMQSGKKDSFPIAGARASIEGADLLAEQPLLLDPSFDEPGDHLTFWFGTDIASGLVLPKKQAGNPADLAFPAVGGADAVKEHAQATSLSERGAVSIQVYGLNRLHLVQERARLIHRLRFLEEMLVSLGDISGALTISEISADPAVTTALPKLRLLQGKILAEMRALASPEAPYSAVAAAYLADLKIRISGTGRNAAGTSCQGAVNGKH